MKSIDGIRFTNKFSRKIIIEEKRRVVQEVEKY